MQTIATPDHNVPTTRGNEFSVENIEEQYLKVAGCRVR